MIKDNSILLKKLESIVQYIQKELNDALALDVLDQLRAEHAITLATRMRVLLNDENRNQSLLSLLNIKDSFYFPSLDLNPMGMIPANILYTSLLSNVTLNSYGAFFTCKVFKAAPDLFYTFEPWWNEIVIDSKYKNLSQISRRDIVLTLADKEGGAHVDKNYDAAYYQTIQNNGLKYISHDGKEIYLGNDSYVESMIYIAQEFLYAYKLYKNSTFDGFAKDACKHKILQLTYFRSRMFKDKTIFNKRYRFLRYKQDNLATSVQVSFDYKQHASYRLLSLMQLSRMDENGRIRYAIILDLSNISHQVLYASSEDRNINAVIYKSKNGYAHLPTEGALYSKLQYKNLEEVKNELNPENPDTFNKFFDKQIIDEPP